MRVCKCLRARPCEYASIVIVLCRVFCHCTTVQTEKDVQLAALASQLTQALAVAQSSASDITALTQSIRALEDAAAASAAKWGTKKALLKQTLSEAQAEVRSPYGWFD